MADEKPLRIILIGPPGAGKGTQAERICEKYNLFYLSPGNMLREEIRNETEIGKQARALIAEGKMVDNKIIIRLINHYLVEKPSILFDGFPRTEEQEEVLDLLVDVDLVIDIQVADEEIVKRISSRRMVDLHGEQHTFVNEEDAKAFVAEHGGDIFQREDDKPETVQNRITFYHKETEPVIEHYKKLGVLHIVDGQKTIDGVTEDICALIDAKVSQK